MPPSVVSRDGRLRLAAMEVLGRRPMHQVVRPLVNWI